MAAISMLMSTAGAEWVNAPMEMKSTPEAAMSRTFASVTPPRHLDLDPSLDKTDSGLDIDDFHIIQHQDVVLGQNRKGLLNLLKGSHLHLDSFRSRYSPLGTADGLLNVSDQGKMIIFYQKPTIQGQSVILAPSHTNCVFFEMSPAGCGLPGIQDKGLVIPDRLYKLRLRLRSHHPDLPI